MGCGDRPVGLSVHAIIRRCLSITAVIALVRPPDQMDRRSLLRLVLFALAVQVLYASGLGHTPPHLHRDEVDIALQAQSIATTGRDLDGRLLPLYFRMHNLGPNVWFHPLIIYVTAAFLWLLPFTESAVRFPTTVIATLNVVLMYFVARRLFGTERWALVAAALLATTPAHFLHGRLAFDFIYPLPFVLIWLLCLLKYLDAGRPWLLFVATTALGVGVFSYIASVIMMPVYLALTALVLVAKQRLSVRTGAVAAAGFFWPLLLWIPWLATQPTFVAEVLNRYGVTGGPAAVTVAPAGSTIAELARSAASHFRFSKVAERVTLYWAFFDPAFLYLIGGFTRMTNSTRLVGVFLMPLILLVPLGLAQMVTVRRSVISVVIFAGFCLAPLAAVLTVLEPYASDRELAVVVFGVLIATYGVERLVALRGRAGRALAVGVIALLPLHFLFFQQHYFGDYHLRSAVFYEWNHRDALEAIVSREDVTAPRPVYLTTGTATPRAGYWRLALVKHKRLDLLAHTTYFDAATVDLASLPANSLVLATVDELRVLTGPGKLHVIYSAPEPGDEPFFHVLER